MPVLKEYVLKHYCILLILIFVLGGCASTGDGTGLSLFEAIDKSAGKIAEELPQGSRVAIVAFESGSNNLSEFIMEELTAALVNRDLEVADRQNLGYVYKELNFQMSGEVSDETAQSIGKFLGAELVITGQLTNLGSAYRFRVSAIHVEKATRESVTRFSVRNDQTTQNMVAALANQTTVVTESKYGVSENTTPQTAGTFFDRGMMFASRGDYQSAIADFSEALKLNPNLSAAYILRARVLFTSVSMILSVRDNFSGVTTIARDRSPDAEQSRVYQQAIDDYTMALKLDPNNADTYVARGATYSNNADFNRAKADYDQAIRLNPKNVLAYFNRGILYRREGRYDEAIADYDHALRLDPKSVNAYHNRGIAYMEKRDLDKAIADFDQALRIDPDFFLSYNARGYVYYLKGNYDKAIADYDAALRIDPNYGPAYNNRSAAYIRKGNLDKLIADFDQAIQLDPNNAETYNNRGLLYMNIGELDKAIADFEAALRIDPNNALVKVNLENVTRQRGR